MLGSVLPPPNHRLLLVQEILEQSSLIPSYKRAISLEFRRLSDSHLYNKISKVVFPLKIV
jgi:hypothetical protein